MGHLAAEYYRLQTEQLQGVLGDAGSLVEATRPRGLALPSSVTRKADWVRVFVNNWATEAPETFADRPGWEREETWMTRAERDLVQTLRSLEEERQSTISEYDTRREELESRLARARADAEAGLRRLLTARGTDLEPVVADALRKIGFDVCVMDPQHAEGDKLEDLQVRDADASDWIALVEVKAYSGGSRVGDLFQIGRFSGRFEQQAGREPDAVWYVVSQFVGRDPGSRTRPLEASPEDLKRFADSGGLAIDTGWLFKVVTAVEGGLVDAVTVRNSLRSQRGALGPRDDIPS